jgi:hypothetical protein
MKRYSMPLTVSLTCLMLVSLYAVVKPRAVQAVIATLVRDVDHPARHPFKVTCSSGSVGGNIIVCPLGIIPAGEEYVIQGVSIYVNNTPATGLPFAEFQATTGTDGNTILIPLTDQGSVNIGFRSTAGVLAMPVYADPGTAITCNATVPQGAMYLRANCAATGYWVSVP